MKQNVQIHRLIEELSELFLSRVVKVKLQEVSAIYDRIVDIDNDTKLAKLLVIKLSEIPPLVNEVVKENSKEEDSTIKEWLDEQFRKNAEAQKQEAEERAIESGMSGLVEDDQFDQPFDQPTKIATTPEPVLTPMV